MKLLNVSLIETSFWGLETVPAMNFHTQHVSQQCMRKILFEYLQFHDNWENFI